ncbi:MAG: hypothetical protein JSR99_07100 [Proteobacteria bacterium]|nr:hypothetical protein [Pseudomonadota bacterium]
MSFQSMNYSNSFLRNSASRIPSTLAEARKAPQPERQRGLWSFLTWSFFLANFLTATEFYGGGAHAATADSTQGNGSSHGGDDGHSAAPPVPGVEPSLLENNFGGQQALPHGLTSAISGLAGSPMSGPIGLANDANSTMASHGGSAPASIPLGDAYNNILDAANVDQHGTPLAGEIIQPVQAIVETVTQTVTDVVHDVSAIIGGAVGATTQVLDGVVGAVTHVVTDTLGNAAGSVLSSVDGITHTATAALGTTIEGVTHAVDHVVPDIVGAIDTTLSGLTGPVADLGSVLSAHATSGGSGSSDILHTAMSDLGISSSGSLSFGTEAPDSTSHTDGTSASGYSQFNLAVQDAATTVAAPAPTDTGGITTIISSALGIGHHATSDAGTSDHSNDTQPTHIPLVDDPTSNLHHGLFG